MTDHDATVVAVLVDCLRALTVMAVEPDRNADALAILAGFTAAGYAVINLPEEIVYGCDVEGHPNNHTHHHPLAVEHGARLVPKGVAYAEGQSLYAIEATP